MQSPETSRRRRSNSIGRSGTYLPPPPPPGNVAASVVLAPVFERFHSFKEFMLLQKDTLEAERAVHLYEQYRYDFKIHTARMLFSQHQDLGFLKQRFDPSCIRQLALEKIHLATTAATQFLEEVVHSAFKDLNLTVSLSDPKMLGQLVDKDPVPSHRVIGKWAAAESSGEDVTRAPWFGLNPNRSATTLVLRKLPGSLTRAEVVEACKDVQGLNSVSILPSCLVHENQRALLVQSRKESRDCSEAELAGLERAMTECYVKSKGAFMIPLQTAWLEFDSEENCSAAEMLLEKRAIKDICVLSPFKILPKASAPVFVCSLSTESRIPADLQQTQALIMRLDKEFSVWGLQWPPQEKLEERMEDKAEEKTDDKNDDKAEKAAMDDKMEDEVKELIPTPEHLSHPFLKVITHLPPDKRLDLQLLYLRRVHFMDYYAGKFCWSERELFETCGAATIRLASGVSDVVVIDDPSAEFITTPEDLARFDKKIQSLLGVNFAHWRASIDDSHPLFAELWSRFCEEKTMLVDAEKYRCGICRKLFKGAEFVHKHLKNKHVPEVEPVRHGVSSMLMKQAFENDDQKLLLFIQPTDDFQKAFQSIRPMPTVQMRNSDSYGPMRRNKLHHRGGPVASLSGDRPYRDWDAPRSRLVEKSAGGNFRTMMRYDDL
eukprot:Gregarina_sp_Poly_1__8596@NODE_50_length_17596_cov_118_903303_g43_i0_p2_GENE_NODE_50_length_17596_cov_118_903303_g43_i0NODE_50_length_17596_cov_118_903303_g43_i0_p2_ORF_typecomplete_len659_score118_94ARS2/PF04959_13/6e03ARS2/PF04959_13/5_9e19DUF3546/PF12066_8/2_5e09DUF3546/PF12066_8/1_6e04DUF4187/PF13821_6/0_013DUF629/PF04780_12/0_18zfBED/PF02892_15/0_6DUF4764/PF15961_5/3_5e03DUF4764/PF15961_5/0_44_NODE_50_length_17596_cov_118_903303_g43_i040766052